MSRVSGEVTERPARVGELCTCGRCAMVVYEGGRVGATGDCGRRDGGEDHDGGVCTFCGDQVDHDHYARAETAAGRDAPGAGEGKPQGGRCPLYRLRLADPLPQLHPESVRPFDAALDRRERAEDRLRRELLEVLLAAGATFDATYTLPPDVEGEPGDTGSLEDVAFDIGWFVRQALGSDPHDVEGHHPEAGQDAVSVLVLMLRARLDDLGATPNPLTPLDAATLLERVGGDDAWTQTVAHDRPLLVARRVARRALDPETPTDIYRPWSP